MWESVREQSQNGVIITYELMYQPKETFGGRIGPGSTNTTDMTIILSNLQEYVIYAVSVRAYTSAGPGPFSAEIELRTLEDSRIIVLFAA